MASPPSFVFDAGALARVYASDVSTTNLRSIFTSYSGRIFAPDIAAAEVTSAWLAFVRASAAADPRAINWNTYLALMATFQNDVTSQRIQLLDMQPMLPSVLEVVEDATALNLECGGHYPTLHAHDAHYLALAKYLAAQGRVVLVTNDRAVWLNAQAFGIEAFHGNTCDRGGLRLDVGMPLTVFPDGPVGCKPCSHAKCPSKFTPNFNAWGIGSGIPDTQPEILKRASV